MSVNGERQLPPPTLEEVRDMILALAEGRISREDAAVWATRWIVLEDPEIYDKRLWQALDRLSGADMVSTDRPYLYNKEDFEAWLKEMLAGS